MSQEDLSAGFANPLSLQQRDETFTKSVAECTHYNAQLLNALVTRVNTLEASAVAQTSTTEQLTADVRKALGMLEDSDKGRPQQEIGSLGEHPVAAGN